MFYMEKERQLPIYGSADVVVIGSGPAGFSAALAAARLGARVMLIESAGALGGISTTGLMSHFTGTVDSKLYKEILQRSAERNEGAFAGKVTRIIDPEELKTLYMDMLGEVSADYLLYTQACEPVCEGSAVRGVIVQNKSGRGAWLGKVIIDASGDGDIAAKAGVPFSKGREGDGKMQPVTLMFKIAGVDYERALFPGSFETDFDTPRGSIQSLAREHLPHPAGHVLLYKSTLPGIVTCNMTNCTDIDGTSAEDLTRGEKVCRGQMKAIVRFLREYVPGYERCYIISSASMLGVRETRRLEGLYCLTGEDVQSARQFEDWVVRGAYFNFDVHNITGPGLDKTGAQKEFSQKNSYTIPYGCLVPRSVDGLLFAGRNISGTHMAHSNYRAMPICVALGEAAGTAAALAVREGVEPRDVRAARIQQYL